MRIVGKFTDEELELLENLGIEVRDRAVSYTHLLAHET